MAKKQLREQAEEIFSWGIRQRKTDQTSDGWVVHSRGAAKVAEKIAKAAGMDADFAYAAGLLHDIGRYAGPEVGLHHIIDGYTLLRKKELPGLARICLTHTFCPKSKVNEMVVGSTKENEFLKKYIAEIEYDEYDKLIQLADFMAGGHGVTTVERRFCSVLARHGLKEPRCDLLALLGLKKYFDEKCGVNVYWLFRKEIEETSIRGVMDEKRKSHGRIWEVVEKVIGGRK